MAGKKPFVPFSPQDIECPQEELGTLYVVTLPAENLGGFARGYDSMLVACNLSLENSTGIYQCRLNRSQDDPVEVWSATVSIDSPTPGTPAASSPIGTSLPMVHPVDDQYAGIGIVPWVIEQGSDRLESSLCCRIVELCSSLHRAELTLARYVCCRPAE